MPRVLYAPSNTYHAKFRFAITGKPTEAITTLSVEDRLNVYSDASSVAIALGQAWVAAWPVNAYSNACGFVGVDVVRGNGTEQPIYGASYNLGTPRMGTATSAFLPLNCALIVKKNTAKIGKRYRGRMYLPSSFIAESAVDAWGTVSSSIQSQYNGFCAEWMTQTVSSKNLNPVLCHPVNVGGTSLVPEGIDTFSIAGKIGTQRRRLR